MLHDIAEINKQIHDTEQLDNGSRRAKWLVGCTDSIGVNAAGDASPAIFGQPGTKCLISPKVWQNCYQIACRTDAYDATIVCSTSKTPRQSKRECDSPYFARAVTSSTAHFSLCLHVGINARWVSVTYFLLGHLVPANIRQPLMPLTNSQMNSRTSACTQCSIVRKSICVSVDRLFNSTVNNPAVSLIDTWVRTSCWLCRRF